MAREAVGEARPSEVRGRRRCVGGQTEERSGTIVTCDKDDEKPFEVEADSGAKGWFPPTRLRLA